jgi:hypothetical protein
VSIRFAKPFRPAVTRVRELFAGRDRALFDFLCAAGQLGHRLPDDDIKLSAASGVRDPRRRLAREFPRRKRTGSAQLWARSRARLVPKLLEILKVKKLPEEDRALRVLLAYVTIALAPDCSIPRDPLSRAAWDTAVELFHKLLPSRLAATGPLDCILRRLRKMNRESAAGLRLGRLGSGRTPGPQGRELAVDPELIARVGKTLGRKFEPGYLARYLFYAKPGDHIWPHPDDPKYAVTVLVCLRHEHPPGTKRKSAFRAYWPDGSIERFDLAPGEALAVEPGLIHAREPIRRGERVVLLSIGLKRAG